ncbi:uncharacterized protein LOC110835506 [Zootermopsis nevadensis]|uniref:uncharacterized protein LOC110835506 n=1 Tax=Zootermopsis nevadensis TaxID=136037 RepID=UPI000B8E4466|nr:uncharacterized protein LOC110835506 [Zootermopsis nevadensis]
MEEDGFCDWLIFSDEVTFHLCGKVNKHNVQGWGMENPHCYVEHQRDSPKVNVFCAVSKMKVYSLFFFAEQTVTGLTYLDMVTEWLLPQLNEDRADFILQQDGAPPHFHREVRAFLNQHLPQRWIRRGTDVDQKLLSWPPHSPDLTPCDFFLWGYVKDQVFVPPLTATILDLKVRIRATILNITADMLGRVWEEMDYHVDVCRVTKGAHIEHL